MRKKETLDSEYFDALYASDPDPWKFASSAYEKDKYEKTLAALPEPRYGSGLEIGCSIGVLTRELAQRCDALVAVDAAGAPLSEAMRRCVAFPQVRFEQMTTPGQWPSGAFDLILLSEVVYYLSAKDVVSLAGRVAKSLAPRADVVLVHWTGDTDYPLTGDEAADLFIACMSSTLIVNRHDRYPKFRLDVLRRR